MQFDLPTLVIILVIVQFLQILAFLHLFIANKAYRGIGWWLLWSIAEAIGIGFILLRDIPSIFQVVVIVQNSMIIAGAVFLYFGVKRFFNKPLNLKMIVPVLLLFLSGLLYYLLIDDDIQIRSCIINSTLAYLALLAAYNLFVLRPKDLTSSAHFIGVIFLVHSGIFIYRTVMILAGVAVDDFFSPTMFNLLPYFDVLLVSLVWTFGFVIMINQRMRNDMMEDKEEMRESESRFGSLFENMSEGVALHEMIFVDSIIPVDYRILGVNEAFEKHTNISAERARGALASELYGMDKAPYLAEYSQVVLTGKSLFFESHFQEMNKEFSISVISLKPGHFATIFADITRHKQLETETNKLLETSERSREALLSILEDQLKVQEAWRESEEKVRSLNEELEQRVLQRTAELESVNKELEAFSYSVSHDLRAPLRHISGYVDLLSRRYSNILADKGKHYLDNIADSTHQMGVLIDDLLQFSRSGRQELKQSDVDMNLVLEEALKSVNLESKDRNIEWEITDLPKVNGDYNLLRLVWVNLLNNAIKFTRKKMKARIEIGFQEIKNEYEFFIRDNGAGFDMKYADKLFGVFQRLHSSNEFEGTGIGLANVRRIVTKHGGRTWAEAELDKGATFYFTLPKK
jgi:signal transduction histidine kinase